MMTTVDLPEELPHEVRTVAERRGWMLKTVFVERLRLFLNADARESGGRPIRLNHTIVHGEAAPPMSFAEMLETSGVTPNFKP